MYNWLITKDHIADPKSKPGTNSNALGMMGPSGCDMTEEQVRNHPDRERFKMYDDDKELYYEGLMVHDEESSGFEPLEDFGMPNAGATEIKYFNNKTNEWKTL